MSEFWPHLVGYSFAAFIGDFFVRHIVTELWKGLGATEKPKDPIRPSALHPQLVGFIERFLYVCAIQMGAPEFIGFWLAVKVGGQWNRWSEGTDREGPRNVAGREFFNVFLIGNGLSIAYSIVGAKTIAWLLDSEFRLGIGVPVALCILTSTLWLYVRSKMDSDKA